MACFIHALLPPPPSTSLSLPLPRDRERVCVCVDMIAHLASENLIPNNDAASRVDGAPAALVDAHGAARG